MPFVGKDTDGEDGCYLFVRSVWASCFLLQMLVGQSAKLVDVVNMLLNVLAAPAALAG